MAEEKKSNKSKIIIAVIVVIFLAIIAALGAVIYNLLNNQNTRGVVERSASEGLIVDGNINEKVANARFTTDMNTIWTFASGNPVSTNAHIGNSERNKYDTYFEIYLDDEEQTLLYSSPVLPVGTQIDELKLDKVLPDGNYDALCTFHILDDVDPSIELSKVSFNVTLMFIPT